MVRRRYEEDSSNDAVEEFLLHCTGLLRGGQEDARPTKRVRFAVSSSSSEGSDVESVDSGSEPETPFGPRIRDYYKYLEHVCKPRHTLVRVPDPGVMHTCSACNEDEPMQKFYCKRCKMYIHHDCSSDPDLMPLPCIYPTPWANIRLVNLKHSTDSFPAGVPKIPAILVKCFFELQKKYRIKSPKDEFWPPSPEEKTEVDVLFGDLLKDVNIDLDAVPSPTILACVMKFIQEFHHQLITPEEEQSFTATTAEQAKAFVQQHVVEPHRLHTLAALMLHLRTISYYNKMSEQCLAEILNSVFAPLAVLLKVDPQYWLSVLVGTK